MTNLPNAEFDQLVETFLAEYTGQNLTRVGGAKFAIESLMGLHKIDHVSVLLAQAREQAMLRQQVINALTVAETWFFRDHIPFVHLSDALRELSAAKSAVNILCWPCASGEEAYSIAAVAHAQGLNTNNVYIDARDINSELLDRARVGKYSMHSFRGGMDECWRNGLNITAELISVETVLSDMVNFSQGNIREAYALCGGRLYDVIFCRNLLIYLSEKAQQEVVEQLSTLLRPGGLLFVGHAETGIIKTPSLIPLARSGAFAFKRAALSRVAVSTASPTKVAPERISVREATIEPSPPRRTTYAAVQTLAELKFMADAGRLEEAQLRCNALLQTAGNDLEVSYICALVAMAQGQHDRSRELIDHVLKQAPNHTAALLISAAQHEAKGDRAAAQSLRARAAQSGSADTEAE